MTDTQALQAAANNSLVSSVWNQEQVELIAGTLARDANLSAGELALFAQVAQRTGLDPFRKQIYAVRYEQNAPVTFQVGIDGFRVIAKRSGKLEGLSTPQWCGEDGEWRDVWLSQDPPSAARVAVHHRDYVEPVFGIALYSEYHATRYDKELRQRVPNKQWATRPAHMLAKCAEALAIRRAFPDDVGGLYTDDELEHQSASAESADTITGEYHEVGELYGADSVSLDTLVDYTRALLREFGATPGHLRLLIPDWEGANVREGLQNWAEANPNTALLETLRGLFEQMAEADEEAAVEEDQQNAAAEAEAAGAAEGEAAFEAAQADEGRLL